MVTRGVIFIVLLISLVYSCRPIFVDIAEDAHLLGEPVSVRIKFLGTSWKSELQGNIEEAEYQSISEGKINNSLGSYIEDLGYDNGVVEVENISNISEGSEYLSWKGLSSVKGSDLPNGTKCKILAYKRTGNSYIFHKEHDFVLGEDSHIKLDSRQNYTLIVFSVVTKSGDTVSPVINDKNNFYRGYLSFISRDNSKVFYQRIDNFVPDGNAINQIDVRLVNKVTSIRIILDSSDILGGNIRSLISGVRSSKLTYTSSEYINFKISDGKPESVGKNNEQDEVLNFGLFGEEEIKKSEEIKILIDKERIDVNFSAEIQTQLLGINKLSFTLKNIRRGYRNTFRVKLKQCGGYLGVNRTNWRQFMCHNLGANYDSNPFVASSEIHGSKYQWGKVESLLDRSGKFVGRWNTSGVSSTEWLRGGIKTLKDPCPEGYRVPTRTEFESLLRNNKISKIGPWSIGYDSALRIGSNLVLPLGDRVVRTGENRVYEQGKVGGYWSSTLQSGVRAYILDINVDNRDFVSVNSDHRVDNSAMSIRCIKEN